MKRRPCLQQAFSECRRVLEPDGLFVASVFGGESLFQLRRACHAAEEERRGGVAQRLSPLMHVCSNLSLRSRAMHVCSNLSLRSSAMHVCSNLSLRSSAMPKRLSSCPASPPPYEQTRMKSRVYPLPYDDCLSTRRWPYYANVIKQMLCL
jgi:SAM-dependent methyltransferase